MHFYQDIIVYLVQYSLSHLFRVFLCPYKSQAQY